tara:strand:- start:567 stop:1322 length:756 start_codon:yes stop_codon:yes gene_type:complete
MPTRHDGLIHHFSRIELVCTKCKEEVAPTVNQFVNQVVGCGCNLSNEFEVLQFVRAVCEQRFQERNLIAEHRHRDPTVRGVGGRPLEFDIVVFESIDGQCVPLLFIEVDGRHHFDSNFRYGRVDDRKRHTFEHDVIKEEHALNQKASMARLEVETIARDKADWKRWLQGKIEAAVRRELPHHIYRLSARDQYVSGEYATRRKGLRIDPELPAGQPFIATGILVDVSPMPQPVNQQRTIDQMFAAPGSPSGV